MLKIGQKREPERFLLRAAQEDEPEAFIVMAPITPAMRRRAWAAGGRFIKQAGASSTADLDDDMLGDMSETVSRELIRLGAIEWGGIGDADGKPLDLTPDRDIRFATASAADRPGGNIDLLLEDDDTFGILDLLYVRADALRRAEKNASSVSPNGTGEAGTQGSATASSAAKPKRRAGARSAHTAKTSSAPKRAKGRGTSSRAVRGK